MSELGLLLDVDGPIASPESRTVAIPSILDDLIALAGGGVPIAFITGRSDEFIRTQVVEPLLARGLGTALERGGAGMFGVFEKGAVWAEIGPAGYGEISVDSAVAFPQEVVAEVRDLVHSDFDDLMFFDETKRAMISVEQRTEVPRDRYLPAQKRFDDAAVEIVARHGLGIRNGVDVRPDAGGAVPFRVDPTIISTDIESVTLDKDRGAERALAFFAERGELPTRWRTVGDSRSDYLMADHLHSAGYDVAHVDVRPSDGILERPYEVEVMGDLVHDHAGAELLRRWVETLQLR